MELKQYATLLWHWAWLIVLGTIVAGVTAFVVSLFMQPVYRASATLLVNEAPSDKASDYTAILTSERLARTYSELLTKRPVLDEAIRRLALATGAEELAKHIDIQLVRDTQLIEIGVENPDPQLAAALANLIPQVFGEQNQALQSSRYASSKESLSGELEAVRTQIDSTQAAIEALGSGAASTQTTEYVRLQAELAQYRQTYAGLLQSYEAVRVAEAQSTSNVTVVEPATPPERPVRPRVLLNTALAGLVGLMLAVGVVFLIEYLDDSLKSPDQVSQGLALPVLGVVARMSADDMKSSLPMAVAQPRSHVTESFRSLRTNIQFSSVDRPVRTLLITSPGPEEGKTTIVANLGIVMAQAGLKVILLDADLRRPCLHKLFHCPDHNGLTELMLHPDRVSVGAQQPTGAAGLGLIPAGPLPPNPAELLASERMVQLLKELQSHGDIVLIDTPPCIAVTDAVALAGRVDGVILVVDTGHTTVGAAAQAKELLTRVGANIVGVVMNRVVPRNGYGYYYPYYEYGTDGRKPSSRRRPFGLGRAHRRSHEAKAPAAAQPEP